MNAETKRYKVTILGESYSLVSDETEESVLRAARLVDERMSTIMQCAPLMEAKKAAVLASLQIASELIRLEKDKDQQTLKNQALADLIEQVVSGSSSSSCITK